MTQFLIRFATYAAILVATGALLLATVLVRRAAVPADLVSEMRFRAARAGLYASLLLLILAPVKLYQQITAIMFPGDSPWPVASAMLGDTTWGRAWTAQVVAAILGAIAFTAVVRRSGSASSQTARASETAWPWVLAAIAVAGFISTPAFSGHAIAAERWRPLVVLADVLHVGAAGAWIGTLLILVASVMAPLRRLGGPASATAIEKLIRAFSPIAMLCAGTVVGSGVLGAIVHVPQPAALFSSDYGRVLIGKVLMVAGVLLMGWFNWKRSTPRIHADGGALLARFAGAELGFALLVLALTSVLVVTPPA